MNNDQFNDVILLACIVAAVSAFAFDAQRIGWIVVVIGTVATFGGWRR